MENDDTLLSGMDDMFQANGPTPAVEPPAPSPATAETPPAQVETPAPQAEAQPRSADGKFASKEVAQPQAAAPIPAAPVIEKPKIEPEQFKGYLDERDKRKAAETRAAELERQLQEARAAQTQPAPAPSVNDPAYADYLRQQVESARISERFDTSELMATEKHGETTVKTAMDWAMDRSRTSPAFAAEYLKQKHPIDWAVKQHKRDVLMSQIGDDPDAWVRARYAELNGGASQVQAQPSAAPPQPAPAAQADPPPPRSIVNASAAGGGAAFVPPAGEFAMVDEAFK